VWNDLARHYRLDPDFVSLMGTSMGGYGAYRFASLYPDLFAKVVTNVGPPGEGIWVPVGAAERARRRR
jgi:pimeloyl-ACP methyl ester carboxylesterase